MRRSDAAHARDPRVDAIFAERSIRHLTPPLLRKRLGEHWPSKVAAITREADAAVDSLIAEVELHA